jgi:hypothetical protein
MVNKRDKLIVVIVLVVMLLTAIMIGRQFARLNDSVVYRVPSRDEMLRSYPELEITPARFQGIWGDFDRGAWIFEYGGSDPLRLKDALLARLVPAGWNEIATVNEEVWLERIGPGATISQLRMRHTRNTLRVLVLTQSVPPGMTTLKENSELESYLESVAMSFWTSATTQSSRE